MAKTSSNGANLGFESEPWRAADANAVLGRKTSFKDTLDWVSMSMSGDYCILGYDDSDTDPDEYTPPVVVFDRAFNPVATPPSGSTDSWMDNLLFLLELKSSPAVIKLAKTNSYTSRNTNGEKNYFAEAFAAINTAGTRFYFGSNWGVFDDDYSDEYRVSIPAPAWTQAVFKEIRGTEYAR